MLYEVHEMQRAMLEPWRYLAQAGADAFNSPLSPWSYLPNAKRLSAGFDLMLRVSKRYTRRPFGIEQVMVHGQPADVTEDVVLEKPFCNLLHFSKGAAARGQPRVLIFAPLSGHFATLLRDTARTMLADHDVYITDWKDARDIPLTLGPFHFDDYVDYVREFITFLS